MARPLLELRQPDDAAAVAEQDRRIGGRAGGALAVALSALVVGTLVVTFSNRALTPSGTVAEASATSGTISLTDDDEGRSLFDLADMAPGRPAVHCIEIAYEGTILPVDLAMRAEASGELAAYLDVAVEQGRGGGFGDCTGFEATEPVFDGTLDALAASGWIDLGSMVNTGQRISYRISFELQDRQEALGRTAGTSFVWEVSPS